MWSQCEAVLGEIIDDYRVIRLLMYISVALLDIYKYQLGGQDCSYT